MDNMIWSTPNETYGLVYSKWIVTKLIILRNEALEQRIVATE